MIKFKREEIENMSDDVLIHLFKDIADKLKEKITTFPFIITNIHEIRWLKEKLDFCIEEITKRAI